MKLKGKVLKKCGNCSAVSYRKSKNTFIHKHKKDISKNKGRTDKHNLIKTENARLLR
jgi:hypothetical protein